MCSSDLNISSRTDQAHNNIQFLITKYNELQSSNMWIQNNLENLRKEYNKHDLGYILQTSNMILELNNDVDKLSSPQNVICHDGKMQITKDNIFNLDTINITNDEIFDAGLAVSSMTFQIHSLGLHAHQMAGFSKSKLKTLFTSKLLGLTKM